MAGRVGANLDQMTVEQLQQLVRQNPASANQVAARFNVLAIRFEARNDALTALLGAIHPRDKNDENRIEDLIELRDKINDGVSVYREDEEYRVGNSPRSVVITGDILKAMDRAQNFLAECIEQFFTRNKDQIEAEHEGVRYVIRQVDHVLGNAHVGCLAAFLGIEE